MTHERGGEGNEHDTPADQTTQPHSGSEEAQTTSVDAAADTQNSPHTHSFIHIRIPFSIASHSPTAAPSIAHLRLARRRAFWLGMRSARRRRRDRTGPIRRPRQECEDGSEE
jgi:hypothetical protein